LTGASGWQRLGTEARFYAASTNTPAQELIGYAKRRINADLPDGVRQLAGSADLSPALAREPGWAGVRGG